MDKSNTLLNEIREFTEGCHEEVEKNFDLFSRIKTLEGYKNLLNKLYSIYFPLENNLENWAPKFQQYGINIKERMKLPLLLSDISALDPASTLHVQEKPPKSFFETVGALYVMEGSTLGGQIIYKHVKSLFTEDEPAGISFYRGYGAKTGLMWKQFCEFLERLSEDLRSIEDRRKILISAQETFIAFKME